ncbi:MAG: DUF819 family protein [Spirochaetaceae bacterium]
MDYATQWATGLGFVILPASVIYTANRFEPLSRVSPVIWCYLLGIVLGNAGLLPASAAPAQQAVAEGAVALSVPLLLFSADLRNWRALGRNAGLSMALAAASVTVVVGIGHLLFAGVVPQSAEVGGLLVGVYTGGTPNLAAIRSALQVDPSVYVTVHTADVVVGGLYILFIITAAKPLFSRLLLPFSARISDPVPAPRSEGVASAFSKAALSDTLRALVLAIALVAVSVGIAELLTPQWSSVAVILFLTTLAIGASLFPAVQRLETSFSLGEYIVLVFCVAVGSMADLTQILGASPAILLLVTYTVAFSLLLHLLLARACGIDVDTMIVTSTAAICSPPFVGMVAVSIDNRAVVAAGITAGILGYAAGNYLGVGVGLLLRTLAG